MNKNLLKRIFTSIALIIILLTSLFFHKYSWLFLISAASIICFIEFNNLTKKIWKNNKTSILFSNLISFAYLIFFIFSALNLSKQSILFVLLICVCSDVGGYVIGKLIGGKKLTKISPNKTISGTIGSFVFSLVTITFFFSFDNLNITSQTFLKLISFTLIISLICQTGDLFISYFKRKAKVKDTGTILPGHGGLLDRVDGIIFAVPGAFLLSKILFYL